MEAIVSDKQCGYYVKLVTFILGLCMKVLHTYFEQNILNAKDHLEFYMFLDENKHNLFHECYPRVECCKCSQNCRAPPFKKGGLTKNQFMLLFECGPLIEIDHYRTGYHNEITKECLCRIMAKRSNDVDCMDITIMYAIIQSCCFKNSTVIHGNPRCIEVIKETRNFLAHVPNACISKSEFDTRFAETEQAILEIGSSLGKYFAKENKKEVDSFKASELSIEVIKRIIKTNVDETITKKLRTIIEDQRKCIVQIKDEIIDHLKKYRDELSIDINKLRFEVKQSAFCSSEEGFEKSAGPVSQMNVAAGGPDVQVTEKDNNIRKESEEYDLEMGVPVAEQIIDDSGNKAQVATGNVISQKTYFARLGHATFHLIPNMLRELLAHLMNPPTLLVTVRTNRYLSRRLKSTDWKKIDKIIYTGYGELDFSLMYTIIRTCFPHIQPSGGWGYPNSPKAHEVSLGDDIERCQRYRNSFIHRGNTTVSYQELNEFFSDFKTVARRFEIVLGKEPYAFVSQFDVLKTCSMDEDINIDNGSKQDDVKA